MKKKVVFFVVLLLYFVVLYSQTGVIYEDWRKYYGTQHGDYASDLLIENDSTYLVLGTVRTSYLQYYNPDAWLLRLNENGDTTFIKSLGHLDYDSSTVLIKTSDNGYMVGGRSYHSYYCDSVDTSFYGFWIVKMDSSFDIEWEKLLDRETDILSMIILIQVSLI